MITVVLLCFAALAGVFAGCCAKSAADGDTNTAVLVTLSLIGGVLFAVVFGLALVFGNLSGDRANAWRLEVAVIGYLVALISGR